MKKTTFLKTLLVAVGLLLGGVNSLWAEVTPYSESYSSSSTTDGWSTKTGGRFTPAILNEDGNYFLSVAQSERNNNGTTVTGTVIKGKASAGDDFTLMFDMRLSSSTNQANTEFKIFDAANSSVIISLKETGTWATTWTLNGLSTKITLPNSNKGNGSNTIADVTWCSYKISRSGSLTYLTITNKETDEVIFERQTIDGSSSTGGLGDIQFISSRYLANFAIDNIVVRELQDGDVPVVTPVNYTIKYVDESSNKIAEDVVTTSFIGAEISASDNQVAPVYFNDQKYIYKSGNESPITLGADEAANVITLVFREAATYNYTINAIDGEANILKQLASSTGFEDDVLSFGYPTYVLKEGKLWNCGTTSQSYKKSFTLDADNKVFTITYSSTDIENVVFYSEAEDVAGMTAYRSGNADARSSQAAIGYATEDVIFTNLPAGKYKLTFVQYKSTSGDGTMTFMIGDNEFSQTTASSNWTSKTFDEFSITSAEDVILKAGGNDNQGVDFVYIVKTGDITEAVPGSNATGFLTFAADVALDFSATETKAYIATAVADSKVQLTQVTKVPAGTGLILERANGSTEAIPVLSGDADDVSANKLARGTGAAVDAGYVLVNRAGTAEFAGIGTDKPVVAKDQAYLNIAAEAPYLQFVFAESETTGISTVKAAAVNDAIYNLNGQRVAKAQKGLYIMNGKKVVLK